MFLAHSDSYPHRLSVATVNSANGIGSLTSTLSQGSFTSGTIEDFAEGIALLTKGKEDSAFLLAEAQRRFPMAMAFGASKSDPPRMLKEFDQSQINANGLQDK